MLCKNQNIENEVRYSTKKVRSDIESLKLCEFSKTPQQNDIGDQKNRTLMNIFNVVLIENIEKSKLKLRGNN